MNNKLSETFYKWNDRHDIHQNRHLNIIHRQVLLSNRWIEIAKTIPINSPEGIEALSLLRDNLRELFYEAKENFLDMASDSLIMMQVLQLLQEHFEKLPNEKSNEPKN